MKILVYSPIQSERLKYALQVVFEYVLQWEVELSADQEAFQSFDGVKLSYAYQSTDEAVNIIPHDLLQGSGIEEFAVNVNTDKQYPYLFANNDSCLGFDLFALVFFFCSRYEEYWPHIKDKHGRFAAKHSLAFKNDFLQIPLVNLWVDELFKKLLHKFGEKVRDKRKYNFVSTVDVDNAYAYLEKGPFRTLGAYARSVLSGDLNQIQQRFKAQVGNIADPYDTFDQFIQIQQRHGIKTKFFFLVGDYGLNDKNVPIHSRKFQSLIKHVNDYCSVALHPSFASNAQTWRVGMEKDRLSSVVHLTVSESRQHFLILDLPQTYRVLLDHEITADYSMGYPDEPGFRASICSPFPFYDLELEKQTALIIHPFSFMEATFRYYKPEDLSEMMDVIAMQLDQVKAVKGQFCTLWHSDSLSEIDGWQGWSAYYEEVVKQAAN